jgi:small basic protein
MKTLKRMAARTVIFALLTLAAFGLMERLTVLTGFPEVMQGMKAAAILAWAEITIMWIRIAMSPSLDVQQSARLAANNDAMAAAVVYAAHQVTWAVRLAAFIILGWVL